MWVYIYQSWTEKELKNAYIGEYAPPIDTPWIYHNATLWLISMSSDGSNWITISDKNLGATTVWNSWDTLSQANCGKYYQWGNNYGFPFTWSVTTSSTRVNAQNYWPWNYYNSSTFITYNWAWDTTDNWNLWGGVTWTNEAMKWPCASWFHVPLKTEWQAVRDVRVALGGWSSDWTNFWIALKLPIVGWRIGSSAIAYGQGSNGTYWSSSRYNANNAYRLTLNQFAITPQDSGAIRADGYPVRPFKNEAVQPDTSRTKLY